MRTDNIQTKTQRLNCDKWSNRGPARQSGFTLIEIAIVLVIIGLLLGGVLKGQELINTARVRSLSNNIDGITSAWFSFSDRYGAFPGDYAQASVNLPNITTNGDGSGIVGDITTINERALVWSHLQAAGYITGSYPDPAAVTVAANMYSCPVTTCPDNGFGQGMVISRGALQQSAVAATGQAHELLTGRAIPSDVLAELDRKIDDGTANAGSMQLGQAGVGWVAADITACQNTTDNTLYNMQTPSDNCAAVFRNF
jgi:prepilin-type N-terminal cleavage/methylation domain-containing protein